MLFREVRGCFFQERVFRLKLAVTSFQLAYALLVRHVGRDRLASDTFPVGLHPESESGVVNTGFPRDLRYRQRVVDDSLSGLLLELRSKSSASWHGIPFLSGESYWIPVRERWGTSAAPQGKIVDSCSPHSVSYHPLSSGWAFPARCRAADRQPGQSDAGPPRAGAASLLRRGLRHGRLAAFRAG